MIEDRSKKYLKNKINASPVEPTKPFIKISINDKRIITKNSILLKKFSYSSSFPNLVLVYFIFSDNFVFFPV